MEKMNSRRGFCTYWEIWGCQEIQVAYFPTVGDGRRWDNSGGTSQEVCPALNSLQLFEKKAVKKKKNQQRFRNKETARPLGGSLCSVYQEQVAYCLPDTVRSKEFR